MDVRIGVIQSAKELEIELDPDADADKVKKTIDAALDGSEKVLWLTDRRGRQVAIASERIAYVELGSPEDDRRIGFGS